MTKKKNQMQKWTSIAQINGKGKLRVGLYQERLSEFNFISVPLLTHYLAIYIYIAIYCYICIYILLYIYKLIYIYIWVFAHLLIFFCIIKTTPFTSCKMLIGNIWIKSIRHFLRHSFAHLDSLKFDVLTL